MNSSMERVILVFAVLATLGLILNMVAIPLNTQEIFEEKNSLAPIEVAILLGFAAVLVFDFLVFAWVGKQLYAGHKSSLNWMTWVLSLGCLILLVGDKVLLDELGREHILGVGAGEWLVLYICFAGQMVLNLLVLFRFLPFPGKRDSKPSVAPVSD
jgi:hypothetical protein